MYLFLIWYLADNFRDVFQMQADVRRGEVPDVKPVALADCAWERELGQLRAGRDEAGDTQLRQDPLPEDRSTRQVEAGGFYFSHRKSVLTTQSECYFNKVYLSRKV